MTLVGRHMGRYRILEQLGSGGMSVVYKGLDTALDREVAVKVLHPHLASKDESRRRLAREARAVAKLHHPNILEVFDFSAAESEDAFIVTEYIRGRTLREYLDEGGMEPPELAAMIVHELAAALAHAHESGVIHRDLKPENVMVREDGVLKLMDFGIAKLLDLEERMTMTGALVGSPAHMAPEVIEGLEVGPEADVFSLGIMLYAFVTGRLPFQAANTTATLKRILDGTYEDPRARVPSLSDELVDIIAACLMRDPARRCPDAGRLRDALADYLTALGFPRVSEELASFFVDPPSYKKAARQRIVAALLERSERMLAEKRTARALASLNQVLALDENNARALALLDGLNTAQRRRRWLARATRLGVGATAAAALAVGAYLALPALRASRQDPPPSDVPSVPREGVPPVTPTAPQDTAPARPNDPRPPEGRPAVTPPPESDERAGGRKTPSIRPETPRPARVPVTVQVRPYGIIQVDDGMPSPQPLAQHAVEMTPGRHTITVSCGYCEPAEEVVEVKAGVENVFRLRAQLKHSRLSFDYQPAEAVVRVNGMLRTARESLERPFEVQSPRGPASFQHRVEIEVSAPGYLTERKVAHIEPGKPTVLRGSLTAE
ncbi:protein kinase [Myxococcaceae bacterium GXIMD 01537]